MRRSERERWGTGAADRCVGYLLGPDAAGYLVYGPGGHLSVSIMRPIRAAFTGNELLGEMHEEKAPATQVCATYCAHHELRHGAVFHHVALNQFPNWVGIEQLRFAEVNLDEQAITTESLRVGGETVNREV